MTDEPDRLGRLWTPHRMAYVTGEGKPPVDGPPECPFCRAPTLPPDEGLVVALGRTVFVMLNLYPYNPGHLMVLPLRHVADYTDLSGEETAELGEMTQTAMRVIREASGPQGFNLGVNQGAVAGAGIVGHLHQHIVPRWAGDTNFMPLVAHTKVLPQLLPDTRRVLAAAWEDAVPGQALEPPSPRRPPARRPRRAAPTKAAPTKATPTKATPEATPTKATPRKTSRAG